MNCRECIHCGQKVGGMTAPPDNLRTACVICGRLFQAPHGHLKGTLTCSAACFRERKRRKDKERWQRRNGQKGGA